MIEADTRETPQFFSPMKRAGMKKHVMKYDGLSGFRINQNLIITVTPFLLWQDVDRRDMRSWNNP
jgi:hypothetical protein